MYKQEVPLPNIFNIQQSSDGKQYICNTCHKKFMNGKLPCHAVVNEYVCGWNTYSTRTYDNSSTNSFWKDCGHA